MNWARTGRTVNKNGTTVVYTDQRGTGLTIESRRRHIPHANGSGTWDHTTYWVLRNGAPLKELQTLTAAKDWADRCADRLSLIH